MRVMIKIDGKNRECQETIEELESLGFSQEVPRYLVCINSPERLFIMFGTIDQEDYEKLKKVSGMLGIYPA